MRSFAGDPKVLALNFNATETALERARQALSDVTRPDTDGADYDLPAALDEAARWLADDRQAATAYAAHWRSLLGDLLHAADQCGARMARVLHEGDQHVLEDLLASRQALKNFRGPPDTSLRRRIERSVQQLTEAQRTSKALVAAFEDVVHAAETGTARAAAHLFVALAVQHGHDSRGLASRLRSVMADEAYTIAAERRTERPDDLRSRAGLTPSERLALAQELLRRAPKQGEVVVWLRFLNASVRWPPLLEIGPSVCLFDQRWLAALLSGDPAQIAELAPEVLEEGKSHELERFVGAKRHEEAAESEGISDEGDADPSVCLRVLVADSTPSAARSVAVRTADALTGVASLYGTPSRLWLLEDSFLAFTDRGTAAASYAAPPPTDLSVDDSIALANDDTARTLADKADQLGAHLPVSDASIEQAATLSSWLRAARLTSDPPRLLLCDRVIEQVSGWAGFDRRERFVVDYLSLAWTYDRVRNRVANAAFAAAYELRHQGPDGKTLLDIFAEDGRAPHSTVDLRRFLKELPAIAEQLGAGASDRVEWLARRAATPASVKRWVTELREDFTRLEQRRQRLRNALVHGGPLSPRAVAATIDFAERLCVIALADSIEARLEGEDLVDHFLRRIGALRTWERRVRADEPLSEALFWQP